MGNLRENNFKLIKPKWMTERAKHHHYIQTGVKCTPSTFFANKNKTHEET
jgi:hypothetical protein